LVKLLIDYDWENMVGRNFLDTDVKGITADSRQVKPGFLFAALPGINTDGHKYIIDAIDAGAVAVLALPTIPSKTFDNFSISLVLDQNPRLRYAKMVGQFYQSQPEHIAAVTGTNGKSSVVEFSRQLWQACGRPAASFGTLGLVAPGKMLGGMLTTPDPIDLHKTLMELANKGINYLAVEASSHGLAQFRLDGASIKIAAITNFSHDHLDYHKTMEKYFSAKLRLFIEVLDQNGVAVVNVDDKMAAILTEKLMRRHIKILNYGRTATDIIINKIEIIPNGQRLFVNVLGFEVELILPLIGDFQVMNALCALGVVLASGEDLETAVMALEKLEGVRGRLELAARTACGAGVYVDYAHTPDALEHVLRSLRSHTKKSLKIVFGCGGDRDKGKRYKMGEIAGRIADYVIVTDDNPRSENAAEIRRQIIMACPDATEIADRNEAIEVAISSLSSGDLLVIAGKGHEQGQVIGDSTIPFNDVDVVKFIVGAGA
jgi:UDP-N-acetylmuramoyl-L-alanyl-D-glutamate--2,6-diaminopimelate ligase